MQRFITSYGKITKHLEPLKEPGYEAADSSAGGGIYESKSTRGSHFDSLPIEMIQRIAEYFDDERDISSFGKSCAYVEGIVDGNNINYWRRQFLSIFDAPLVQTANFDYKTTYCQRKLVLRNGVIFRDGRSEEEYQCLNVLRQLLVEARVDPAGGLDTVSQNVEHLEKFVRNHGILSNVFNPALCPLRDGDRLTKSAEPLLELIQSLLAPCMFSLSHNLLPVFGICETQQVAYSFSQIFGGPYGMDIDTNWLLHQLNFWRLQLVDPYSPLFCAYSSLDESERPKFSVRPFTSDQNLSIGRHWKSCYAYVDSDEIDEIRDGSNENMQIQDIFPGEESNSSAFQDLELELNVCDRDDWDRAFDAVLRSLAKPKCRARTRAQKCSAEPDEFAQREPRSFRFNGSSCDHDEAFIADGWLNPLPAQHGIPGFQRLTMMKYFVEESGVIDYQSMWAYEGVALPGTQIIVGRWWNPTGRNQTPPYSGPFILWCVDGPQHSKE